MKVACEVFSNVIDPRIALAELREVEKNFNPVVQHGNAHDGNWKSIALFAADGDMKTDKLNRKCEYKKTEAIKFAPQLEKLIDSIPGEKKRVRLLSLPPGAKIYEHYDRTDTMDSETSRLHLPIVTDKDVIFLLNNQRMNWVPGNIYYGDFSFPHSVTNNSKINRVHLVIDVSNNIKLKSIILNSFGNQKPNHFIRKYAQLKYKVKNKLGLVKN